MVDSLNMNGMSLISGERGPCDENERKEDYYNSNSSGGTVVNEAHPVHYQ